MTFKGILRPGHVQIRVLDLEAAKTHYGDAVGLIQTAEDKGRAYFKAWDEYDHHSVVLREAEEPGIDHFAFKVSDNDALKDLARRLTGAGVKVEKIKAGELKGCGERLSFVVPTGHRIELYAEKEQVGNGLGTENPEVWPDGLKGMHPTRLDHTLLVGDDLDGTVKLFREVLGFNLTERIMTSDRSLMLGAFLSVSNKPHDVAFIRGEGKNHFHHASFWLNSWNEVQHAADLITKNRISVDIGPTRHGVTRGNTIYFFDPSGNRNEVFYGGYTYYPDNPTLTWTDDELGRAVFYYEREINENFFSVMT